jgi:cation:H+ antiporter
MDAALKILHAVEEHICQHVALAWVALILSFAILAKCASFFVDSSVTLANKLRVPKLVIGIVLVSLATTAPELAVSLTAALKGNPEMALGNAIGSVICDDGLALPAAGLLAPTVILIVPLILRTSGVFLVCIQLLTFSFLAVDLFLGNGKPTLSRWEGMVLVALFVGYMVFLFRLHLRGSFRDTVAVEVIEELRPLSPLLTGVLFIIGLGGIVFASEFIVVSAGTIAVSLHVPNAVIALTIVAFGTSIPEVATCITAARKGHGALAVGNIIGADILNICWVAGASAVANDLTIGRRELFFMFPAMFVIVGVMLLLLRIGYRLTKPKAVIIFLFYLGYLTSSVYFFPPTPNPMLPVPGNHTEQVETVKEPVPEEPASK